MDILTNSKKPVDVSTLVNKLKVNKTTVYRQIEKMLQKNLLIEVELGDGKKRYELKSLGHHHHLVCKKCGNIDDIYLDEKFLIKKVNRLTKFKIESHNLEFFGRCVKC